MQIKLVPPSNDYQESAIAAIRDFQAEEIQWWVDEDIHAGNFIGWVEQLKLQATHPTKDRVPSTEFWAVADGKFVGRIAIRHELNEALKIVGGHIGYDTAPSYRRLGVASQMLALCLPIAKKFGLSKVLLTCDDTNIASIKVIEKNGGTLSGKRQLEDGKIKRYYWISL